MVDLKRIEPRTRLFSLPALWGSALALCAGLVIAWMDTRPRWDDTGITVGALFFGALIISLMRVPPCLVVLFASGPMLIVELPASTGVLIAIPFALAGSYGGAFVRRRIGKS